MDNCKTGGALAPLVYIVNRRLVYGNFLYKRGDKIRLTPDEAKMLAAYIAPEDKMIRNYEVK